MSGRSLRLKCKDRLVLYMTVQVAHEMDLTGTIPPLIDAAPRYAEGRGIRLPVATGDDLVAVQTLAALKMAKR